LRRLLIGGERMYDRKNNPSINRGDGESLKSYLARITELLSKLEWQSEGHRMWYTHKNPYSCWICELLQIGRGLESELMDKRDSDTESDGPDAETVID